MKYLKYLFPAWPGLSTQCLQWSRQVTADQPGLLTSQQSPPSSLLPPETGDTDGYQKIQIRTSCGPETSQKPLLKTKMHFKELILTTWCALLLPVIKIAQTTTTALFFYIGGLIRQDERFGDFWWRFLVEVSGTKKFFWGQTELTEEESGVTGGTETCGLLGPVIWHPPSHPHQQETLPSDHRKYDCAQINTISYTDPGCSVTSGYKLSWNNE